MKLTKDDESKIKRAIIDELFDYDSFITFSDITIELSERTISLEFNGWIETHQNYSYDTPPVEVYDDHKIALTKVHIQTDKYNDDWRQSKPNEFWMIKDVFDNAVQEYISEI